MVVKNMEEKMWIEDYYFKSLQVNSPLMPKYNDLGSELNWINILKEQV
ncbi:MAG: hypothetical protein ACFFG0_22855 [Candidatus Thorarchaeota archaeon]